MLEIAAGKATRDGDEFRRAGRIPGHFEHGREVIHARAEVVLATGTPPGRVGCEDPALTHGPP